VYRRIVQFAEHTIAELGIGARSLETEGVDPGRMAAALERTGLGVAHELPPDPPAPQRVADQVGSVVSEGRADLVRDGGDQAAREVPAVRRAAFSRSSTKANFDVRSMATSR
jgi:hypothetical protein